MGREETGQHEVRADVGRFLRRGGTALALAAVAHAKGRLPRGERWHVLAPELAAAAEEVLAEIAAGARPEVLETAVRAAMDEKPSTAPPAWARALVGSPAALSRVGRGADPGDLAPALGRRAGTAEDRLKGLAALALALCRSLDALAAAAALLSEEDGRALVRMGHLAAATAEPGAPSRMRAAVKRLAEPGDDRG